MPKIVTNNTINVHIEVVCQPFHNLVLLAKYFLCFFSIFLVVCLRACFLLPKR